MSQQSSRLQALLQREHYIRATLPWIASNTPPTAQGDGEAARALRAKWLHTDIRASGAPALPDIDGDQPSWNLPSAVAVQVEYIINVSDSGHSQLEALDRQANPPRQQQHQDINDGGSGGGGAQSAGNKVLKLRLTDGHTDTQAMTLKPVNGLTVTTRPGAKIILLPGTRIVKGVALLTPTCVRVVGGGAANLQARNNHRSILQRWLGIDEPEGAQAVDSGVAAVQLEVDSEESDAEEEFALAAAEAVEAAQVEEVVGYQQQEEDAAIRASVVHGTHVYLSQHQQPAQSSSTPASTPDQPPGVTNMPSRRQLPPSSGNPYGRFSATASGISSASAPPARPRPAALASQNGKQASVQRRVLPDEGRATASRYDATVKVERKPVMDPPKVTPPHEAGAAATAAPPPVVHKRTLKNLPKQEKKSGFPSSKRKIMQLISRMIGFDATTFRARRKKSQQQPAVKEQLRAQLKGFESTMTGLSGKFTLEEDPELSSWTIVEHML